FMRRLVRGMLLSIGVKTVLEASDGIEGLESIRSTIPDVVILDWEMPLLNGPELVRIVRSPGLFPTPDIPVIMLSGHTERRRILEATKIGVNEFLCKPVSTKALRDRIISILMKPRATVQLGDYYGPEPRSPPPEPGTGHAVNNPVGVNEVVARTSGNRAIGVNDAATAVVADTAAQRADDCFDVDTLTRIRLRTESAG